VHDYGPGKPVHRFRDSRRRDALPDDDWELPRGAKPDDIAASRDRRHRFQGSRRRDLRDLRHDEAEPERRESWEPERGNYGQGEHVAALRDFKRRLKRHYGGRFRDDDLQDLLQYFMSWAREHTDLVYSDPSATPPRDPDMVDTHNSRAWFRVKPDPTPEVEGYRRSGGSNASQTMVTRDAATLPLALIGLNAANRRFWRGRTA